MATLRESYPGTWDEAQRDHVERIASWVEETAQMARDLRKTSESRRHHPIGLCAPSGSGELLRRAFHTRTGRYGHRVLQVGKAEVTFHDGTQSPRGSDTYEMFWSTRRWRLRVPPVALTPEQLELYLQLRKDRVNLARASSLAVLLSDEAVQREQVALTR